MNGEVLIKLVRHATTEHNRLGVYTAPIRRIPHDLPLDRDSGIIAEAQDEIKDLVTRLGAELADVPAGSIVFYSSDWVRAVQTAKATRDQINQTRAGDNQIGPIRYDIRLGEQQFGMADPALARDDPRLAKIRRRYLSAAKRDFLQRVKRRPVHRLSRAIRKIMQEHGFDESMKGTSLIDVSKDLSSWLADIEPMLEPGAHVIAFTHGGVIMASRMSFLGETPHDLAGFISNSENHPHACSITTYSQQADGWQLSAWAEAE